MEEESKHKKKEDFDFTGWQEDVHMRDCPQQGNGFDCGCGGKILCHVCSS